MNITYFEKYNKMQPTWLLSADDFTKDNRVRPKEQALHYAYIGTGNKEVFTMLAFDIDRPDAGAAWLDAGLPPPNLIISKKYDAPHPRQGHAHLVYFLQFPVTKKKATAAHQYFRAIWKGMNAAMGGDPKYNMTLIKNYNRTDLYNVRSPETEPYELNDLFKHVPSEFMAFEGDVNRSDFVVNGRNDRLFKQLTGWAYARKNPSTDYSAWFGAVIIQAHRLNTDGLPAAEVKYIATSVAKYWYNRAENHTPAYLKLLAERRAIMIKALHEKTTKRQIEIAEMKEAQPHLTQAELAQIFGCGIATIKRAYKAMGIIQRGVSKKEKPAKVSNLYQVCMGSGSSGWVDTGDTLPSVTPIVGISTTISGSGGCGGNFESVQTGGSMKTANETGNQAPAIVAPAAQPVEEQPNIQENLCFGPEYDPDLLKPLEYHMGGVPRYAQRRLLTVAELRMVASRLQQAIRVCGEIGVVDRVSWLILGCCPMDPNLPAEKVLRWRKKCINWVGEPPLLDFDGAWPGITSVGPSAAGSAEKGVQVSPANKPGQKPGNQPFEARSVS